MSKMLHFCFTLILISSLSFCAGGIATEIPYTKNPQEVLIRLSNQTGVKLNNVLVEFPDRSLINYGDINPNTNTGYHAVKKAHSYAYVEAWAKGKRLVIQPFDYMGEPFLLKGKYTYALKLTPQGQLFIYLHRD